MAAGMIFIQRDIITVVISAKLGVSETYLVTTLTDSSSYSAIHCSVSIRLLKQNNSEAATNAILLIHSGYSSVNGMHLKVSCGRIRLCH